MSILLKGVEMPKDHPLWIIVGADGTAQYIQYSSDFNKWKIAEEKAVPVPPHGDLIDRDALMKGEGRYIISFGKEGIDVAEISRAPTIIPAELSKEET